MKTDIILVLASLGSFVLSYLALCRAVGYSRYGTLFAAEVRAYHRVFLGLSVTGIALAVWWFVR